MAEPIVIELQARGVRELVASFQTIEQTVIKMERAILAASERGTRDRQQLTQREVGYRENAYSGEARSFEKTERQKTADAERWAKSRERIVERSARMAGQYAKQQADEEIREMKRAYDARERFARNFGGQVISSARAGVSTIVGAGGRIMQGAFQVGGGFGIADSVSREVSLTGMAANMAASSQADPNGKRWKTAEILNRARGTANAYAMDPDDVLKGIGKFKDLTGQLGRGIDLMPDIAKLATAYGANASDLMSNAGNIVASDANKGMSNADVMKLLRVQTMQGVQGAVELPEMARYGARLTAGASMFGGDRATNIATMGAFAQVARQQGGAASPAEAALAAQRFATSVAKRAGALEAGGIKVSDGKGGLRDARGIMLDMLEKSGGDVTKLSQFKLGERGDRVLTGFANIYRSTEGTAADKKAAVVKELTKYTTGVSDQEVNSRAKQRLDEVDKQVTKAMNELRDAVGIELVPELVKLVPVLRDATPMFRELIKKGGEFANWFVQNPIKGIGAVILASVAKDLAGAAIGEAVKRILVSLIGGGGGPRPGGGGSGVVGGALAAGAGTAFVLSKAMIGYEGGQELGQDLAAKVRAWNAGDHERGISPKDAKAQVDAAKGRLKKISGWEQAANLATSPFVDASDRDYKNYKADQGLVDSDALKNALAANTEALNANTAATSGNTGVTAAPPRRTAPDPSRHPLSELNPGGGGTAVTAARVLPLSDRGKFPP